MEELMPALSANNAEAFLRQFELKFETDKSQYGQLRLAWIDLCTRGVVEPAFIAKCLEILLLEENSSHGIANLLLDGMHAVSLSDDSGTDTPACLDAQKIFLRAVNTKQQLRLAVKMATAFRLTISHFDESAVELLKQELSTLLVSSSTVASAAALILHFKLQDHFDMTDALAQLTLNGQEKLAAEFAQTLGKKVEIAVVERCIIKERLRAACRLVDALELHGHFPTVHKEYRRECMTKALQKQLWSVASGIVEDEPELQIELVQAMIQSGEGRLAQEYCSVFNLDATSFDFAAACGLTEEEEAERRKQYLDLDLDCVQFIDTLEGLIAASTALHNVLLTSSNSDNIMTTTESAIIDSTRTTTLGASSPGFQVQALGLDVEWKPGHSKSSQPSLLQLSTDDIVVVVDLLAMAGYLDALNSLLQPLLQASHIYKLGVGIKSDLQKLRGGFPELEAFSSVPSCIDLGKLWKSQLASRPEFTAKYKHRNEISLSSLSQAVLGKPLDKSVQMSNWDRRPLVENQLRYAALDAWSAVKVFRQFGVLDSSLAVAGKELEGHAFTWVPSPPHHHQQQQGLQHQLNNTPEDGPSLVEGISKRLRSSEPINAKIQAVQHRQYTVNPNISSAPRYSHGPSSAGRRLRGARRTAGPRGGLGWHMKGV